MQLDRDSGQREAKSMYSNEPCLEPWPETHGRQTPIAFKVPRTERIASVWRASYSRELA